MRALQLLGRWRRAAAGHLSFTAGCACGFAGAVDLSDMDDLVIDFLARRFAREAAVGSFMKEAAGPAPGSVKALLGALAASPAALAPAAATALLGALEATVTSIEEQHRT
ncbi:MAG: hypothetical protein ACKVQQ_14020 [Burkholderiales bacterium]